MIRLLAYDLIEIAELIGLGLVGLAVALLLDGGVWTNGGTDSIRSFLFICFAIPLFITVIGLITKILPDVPGLWKSVTKESLEPIPAPSDFAQVNRLAALRAVSKRTIRYLPIFVISIPLVGPLLPGISAGVGVLGLLAYIRTYFRARSRGIILMRELERYPPEYYIEVNRKDSRASQSSQTSQPQ